jgi:hypothetical protein
MTGATLWGIVRDWESSNDATDRLWGAAMREVLQSSMGGTRVMPRGGQTKPNPIVRTGINTSIKSSTDKDHKG